MPVLVEFRLEDEKLREEVARRTEEIGDAKELYADIGGHLVLTTEERFEAQVDPGGKPWAKLSPATYAWGYRKRHKRAKMSKRMKGGKRGDTADFSRYKAQKQILIERGFLKDSIHMSPIQDGMEIGTDRIYGPAHQFGLGARSSTGTKRTFGAIPARPFLGFSKDDLDYIREAQADFYRRKLGITR